jgi:hypothetical protein
MRILIILVLLAGAAAGGWWLWNHQNTLSDQIGQYVGNGDTITLEARYSPEKIMESHKQDLLEDDLHKYQGAFVKFHPYLLMEVKYHLADHKTHEGVVLWGMENGEMVLNAENWEQTHGLADCLVAGVTRNDCKVINALAKHKGAMHRDDLLNELHVESDTLDQWIDSLLNKHLVVYKGNEYRLHLQDPNLPTLPRTKLKQSLVTKVNVHTARVSRKYSANQIEKMAQAFFGQDFTIRTTQEVFLPVIGINVLNPDGSISTSHWNALTGQRIHPKYLVDGAD